MTANEHEPEIVAEETSAPLTLPDLMAELALARKRVAELEHKTGDRKDSFLLQGLVPLFHVSDETARKAAVAGKIVGAYQWRKGAPWYASPRAVEDWLRQWHWFTSAEDEARWRRDVAVRTRARTDKD
jgi:hypothetical protein